MFCYFPSSLIQTLGEMSIGEGEYYIFFISPTSQTNGGKHLIVRLTKDVLC